MANKSTKTKSAKLPSQLKKDYKINENPKIVSPNDQRFLEKWHGNIDQVFQMSILLLIIILAFSIRLYSVVKYESIIHEYDPWFNYRVAKYITKNGFRAFFNWFDTKTWYPVGRNIYETTYFGMMFTSAFFFKVLRFFNFAVHIREICVFNGPVFSGGVCLIVYTICRMTWDPLSGLFAAAFIAIIPGYISRSVAGSYDYESMAIFTMTLCFLLWLKALKTGSFVWAVLCGLSYFYMASVWGGYLFVLNLIAVHASLAFAVYFCALRLNRANRLIKKETERKMGNLIFVYSVYYISGFVLSPYVPMVIDGYFKFKSTHLPALLVFLVFQKYVLINCVLRILPNKKRKPFLVVLGITMLVVSAAFVLKGDNKRQLTGRIYHVLGIDHGVNIVNSVSEHQRSSLAFYKTDINILWVLLPFGLMALCIKIDMDKLFLLLYFLFSGFFSYMMVRVMLVFAPIVCIVAGIGLSSVIKYIPEIAQLTPKSIKNKLRNLLRSALLLSAIIFYYRFAIHCDKVSNKYYSNPTVILTYNDRENNLKYIDDYREAFMWMRYNTPKDSKVLSWWDYGYQITGFSKRTVYVDNNTRDEKQIAKVGKILASSERKAYQDLVKLDVDYVLVLFGGKIGYNADDLAKAYWIIKITSGYYDEIKEEVNFNIGVDGSSRFKRSLLFKMLYYRFHEVNYGGYDLARNQKLAEEVELKYLEEAYTTKNWLLRIYRVKKPSEVSDK